MVQRKIFCRVCRTPLSSQPLLAYRNMPCAAQSFPAHDDLAADQGTDLAVYQCPACSLVQLVGRPVPYYRDVIRAAAYSREMEAFRRAQFHDWVTRYGLSGKTVVEIGCGHGEYLTLLADAGTQAVGLEHSAVAVSTCQRRGLRVFRDFPDHADRTLKSAPFDAFITLNFMEHWPRPVSSLRSIANSLVEDGVGLIEVPNFDMIVEKGLYTEFISDHLSYFTRDSLSYALRSAGFEVIECQTVWHDYILSAVVKKRQKADLTLLRNRKEFVERALHTFVDSRPQKRIAVWGAGHQALAAIALSGIGNRITYVVDSAPFKQGRFTPATHLPIVPPATLSSDPVDAVMIMAASYSDEVAATIRKDFDHSLEVAILRDFGLETLR